MLLALDTSTRLAGIALYDGERGLLAEHTWHSANRHTAELLPQVAALLAQAGVRPADLTAVAVALGPGSFTGLRVALAAGKGLALANGLALLGVPTLDAVAYPHQCQPTPVVALVQAGRGRVCWAPYAHGPGGWGAQAAPAIATIETLAQTVTRVTAFAGELSAADRAALTQLAGRMRVNFLSPALALPRPGYLAEIGWRRFVNGERDDPAALNPLYLHEPDKPK
jgi:tRNA threonylcarbamoyladenosine biosynthesis protein TsaB